MPRFSITLLAQRGRAEKAEVEEVNVLRLKVLTIEPFFPAFSVLTTSSPGQQQAPTEHMSSACFSEKL